MKSSKSTHISTIILNATAAEITKTTMLVENQNYKKINRHFSQDKKFLHKKKKLWVTSLFSLGHRDRDTSLKILLSIISKEFCVFYFRK